MSFVESENPLLPNWPWVRLNQCSKCGEPLMKTTLGVKRSGSRSYTTHSVRQIAHCIRCQKIPCMAEGCNEPATNIVEDYVRDRTVPVARVRCRDAQTWCSAGEETGEDGE